MRYDGVTRKSKTPGLRPANASPQAAESARIGLLIRRLWVRVPPPELRTHIPRLRLEADRFPWRARFFAIRCIGQRACTSVDHMNLVVRANSDPERALQATEVDTFSLHGLEEATRRGDIHINRVRMNDRGALWSR